MYFTSTYFGCDLGQNTNSVGSSKVITQNQLLISAKGWHISWEGALVVDEFKQWGFYTIFWRIFLKNHKIIGQEMHKAIQFSKAVRVPPSITLAYST